MMESIQLAQMLADLSDLNAAVRRQPLTIFTNPELRPCGSKLSWSVFLIHPQQESHTATAVVNANKTLGTTSTSAEPSKPPEQLPTRPGLRNHKRTGSGGSAVSTGSSFMSRTASPAKFDKYGRRLLTPPNTRSNSTYNSIPGTPRRDSEVSRNPPFTLACQHDHPPPCSASTRVHVLKQRRKQQIDDDVDRASTLMALYEIRAKLKDQDNSRNLTKLREKIDALHAKQLLGERKDSDGGRMKFSYPKTS